ncbi:hypothetical protein QLQ12_46560 [Actinoplanes sp. NEAU-A12]|uniref:PLAT domain-containing protein n=1 Tax=Actinoplanes sandaracinus TaxID=3045177 RepID=A0ABT6X218_9ACTN|nr:hypothetical protein [Actinoplanes sandaracinus]MDI6106049.1 hypothetical protein [Actinoplanes sandaracinus]
MTGAIAGSFDRRCVKVAYTGSLAAQARFYLSSVAGSGLAPYLTVQVRTGSGDNANCSDFTASSTVFNATGLLDSTQTLTLLNSTSSSYATGLAAWAVTTNDTKTYQFSWRVQPTNLAASKTATFGLAWEARP